MTSHRKLAAILSADAAGYSRLMADDEAATLRSLNDARSLFRERIQAHGGRLIDTAGDSILAEFPSAVEAVDCAVKIQHELAKRNAQLAEHRRMIFRIGINLGDVIEQQDGTIYGDGVNVAARLQALADPGGVCISGTAFDQVEGKLPLQFKFIGEQQVKNIAKPVRAYRARGEGSTETRSVWLLRRPRARLVLFLAAALIFLGIGGALTWQAMRPNMPIEDPVLALPKGPSIAVLPFANLSGDSTQDYFADGITEEIITQLTRFRELFVLARNTTLRYKGQAVDIKKVGRELGARYMVEGSVRKAGGRIRVTAQLLDASSGTHLWAETFDQPLTATNLLSVQDEITSQVVSRIAGIHGVLSRARFKESTGTRTENLAAYDCLLQAYQDTVRSDPRVHFQARKCLEQATTADPSFVEGWAWLALMYLDEYLFGMNPRQEPPLDRALQCAQRAVVLDPASQMANFALARTYYHRRELEKFVTHAEQALDLNPNNTMVLVWLGLNFTQSGQLDRGAALTRKAMKLNPHYPTYYYLPLFNAHFLKGEYERALAEILKWNQPNYFWPLANQAAVYGHLGRREEAQAVVASLLKIYPDFPRKARWEYGIWFPIDSDTERFVDGLRKAGLEIPQEER